VRHADPKQHFLATVAGDIRDSSVNIVIPKGSNAHLIAQEVGEGEIARDLRAVYVNGQRYDLVASPQAPRAVRPASNSRETPSK
jgi:hypothetical protein